MAQTAHPHPGTPSYLMTLDVGEKVQGFVTNAIRTPDPESDFFVDIQQQLVSDVQVALGDSATVKSFYMRDVAANVLTRVEAVWGHIPHMVVSTCPDIAHPAHGTAININRLVNELGVSLGTGPRPGHPNLQTQVRQIKQLVDGLPVVLVEDGIFTGETLRMVRQILSNEGIKILGVVAGFSFSTEATTQTAEAIDSDIEVCEDIGALLDWVPDHDFLPFIPGCGKPLGVNIGGNPLPYYDFQRLSYTVPYIWPFGPMVQWASIPEQSVQKLSRSCIDLVIKMFTELELLNGRSILISDISHLRQPAGVPVNVRDVGDHSHLFADESSRVVDFLSNIEVG